MHIIIFLSRLHGQSMRTWAVAVFRVSCGHLRWHASPQIFAAKLIWPTINWTSMTHVAVDCHGQTKDAGYALWSCWLEWTASGKGTTRWTALYERINGDQPVLHFESRHKFPPAHSQYLSTNSESGTCSEQPSGWLEHQRSTTYPSLIMSPEHVNAALRFSLWCTAPYSESIQWLKWTCGP